MSLASGSGSDSEDLLPLDAAPPQAFVLCLANLRLSLGRFAHGRVEAVLKLL